MHAQQHDAAPQSKSAAKEPEQEGTIKLRHRSEITNPYHVQFRDITHEAGIHFHHERAASP